MKIIMYYSQYLAYLKRLMVSSLTNLFYVIITTNKPKIKILVIN